MQCAFHDTWQSFLVRQQPQHNDYCLLMSRLGYAPWWHVWTTSTLNVSFFIPLMDVWGRVLFEDMNPATALKPANKIIFWELERVSIKMGRAGHPVYRGRHCKVTWWKGYRYGERWVIQSDDVISHILVPDTFGVEWEQTRTLLFDSFAFLFLPQFCATRQDPKELTPSPSSYHLDETFLTQYCVFKLTKQASLVMKEWTKIT